MLSILLFAFVVSPAFSADITNNQAPDFIGDYKLMVVWPKRDAADIPNCPAARYSNLEFTGNLRNVSCECGRKDAKLVLVNQKTRYQKKHTLLLDIITSPDYDEVRNAIRDKCECEPKNFDRLLALKLSDNLNLLYEKDQGITKSYIFAKVAPPESELREVIANIPRLKYEDGALVCDISKI